MSTCFSHQQNQHKSLLYVLKVAPLLLQSLSPGTAKQTLETPRSCLSYSCPWRSWARHGADRDTCSHQRRMNIGAGWGCQPKTTPPAGVRGRRAAIPTEIQLPWREGRGQGTAGVGGCPEAQNLPELQGWCAGRCAGRGVQGGCTYHWVRAASGRSARGRPPERGAGKAHRHPNLVGRTLGVVGHSPGSEDTTLLWGQDTTAQEEEGSNTLPGLFMASWSETQLPRAAHGCSCCRSHLSTGFTTAAPQPALPPQSHYQQELAKILMTKEWDLMICMGPFQFEVVSHSMTCTRQYVCSDEHARPISPKGPQPQGATIPWDTLCKCCSTL